MTQVRQRHRLKPSGEVIAFLTTLSTEDAWQKLPSHVKQFEGARERARILGFDVQPIWLGEGGMKSRQMAKVMWARGIRGALVAPIGGRPETRIDLDWQHQAVVAIGYAPLQQPINRTIHDAMRLTSECYTVLRSRGYKRIGLAMPATKGTRGYVWVTTFLGEQWWHGIQSGKQSVPPLMYPEIKENRTEDGMTSDEIGRDVFWRWFEGQKPDAVIGTWPDWPHVWLRQHGVRVPETVSYATLDIIEAGQTAGMWQDNRRLGSVAMDVLAGQIFRNEIGLPNVATITSIPGSWRDGPTVRSRG